MTETTKSANHIDRRILASTRIIERGGLPALATETTALSLKQTKKFLLKNSIFSDAN